MTSHASIWSEEVLSAGEELLRIRNPSILPAGTGM